MDTTSDLLIQSEEGRSTPAKVQQSVTPTEMIQSIDGCVQSVNQCFNSIGDTMGLICNCVLSWKEIDLQMHQVDAQFQYLSNQLAINLEMYKTRAPIVGKQLDNISHAMEKILDKVLEMDAVDEIEMNMKMKYIEMVDRYMNNLASMMSKLL